MLGQRKCLRCNCGLAGQCYKDELFLHDSWRALPHEAWHRGVVAPHVLCCTTVKHLVNIHVGLYVREMYDVSVSEY